MKKILIISLLLIILCMSVFAITKPEIKVTVDKDADIEHSREKVQGYYPYLVDVIIEKQINLTGLPNAILRVRSENVSQHLQEVMNKIEEKQKARLQRLANLVIEKDEKTNLTLVTGVEEDKFLGLFKVKRNKKFIVQEDGTLVKQTKFVDIFFKEEV